MYMFILQALKVFKVIEEACNRGGTQALLSLQKQYKYANIFGKFETKGSPEGSFI